MKMFLRLAHFVLVLCISTTIILYVAYPFSSFLATDKKLFTGERFLPEKKILKVEFYEAQLRQRGFTDEQIQNMSPLGKWMLAPEGSPSPRRVNERKYLILIWKNGPHIEHRHIKRYTNKKYSPWEQCSAQNCILSYEDKDLHRADAVVFHLHFIWGKWQMPSRKRVDQRWIFMTDESPVHLHLNPGQKLSDYNGLFNWSMTYRMDSDVPVPYGRTIRRRNTSTDLQYRSMKTFRKYWTTDLKASKTKLVAVMGSNCHTSNGRWSYVKMLKQSLGDDLDLIGSCLNGNRTICPGSFRQDCVALNAYKFYLSFENSNCHEYMTEKVFWNAYQKYAVPVIMGTPTKDSQRLLPPHSFLSVDTFTNPASLADYLRYLGRDEEQYLSYHKWRDHYVVLNEHGYFGSASKHYCRVCEALNYNPTAPKIYEDLEHFWNKDKDCARTIS